MSNKSNITEKLAQLRELVAWFEGDDFNIEHASEKFEAASKLTTEIEAELQTVQNTVTVLKEKFDA
jgi:exodeoxyribonuclease VII small subunit